MSKRTKFLANLKKDHNKTHIHMMTSCKCFSSQPVLDNICKEEDIFGHPSSIVLELSVSSVKNLWVFQKNVAVFMVFLHCVRDVA